MENDKTILFSVGSLSVGGAETQLTLLIEGLLKKGWQCDVFVLQPEGPLMERLRSAGAGIYSSGFKAGRGLLIFLEIIKAIYRAVGIIQKNRYQIVHGYLPLANFIIAVAAKYCGVPQIYTSKRALGTHQDRHSMWRMCDGVANYLSTRIIANSESVKEDVIARERVSSSRIELIYNGLDFELVEMGFPLRDQYRKELTLSESDLAVIVVANLIPYKGHADVIRAASKLVKYKNELIFIFVGEDRGIQADLESLAKELSVGRLLFLGPRSDVPSLLSAADIGLVSSHEEGFCNALLEQMAARLPVVATRVGGNAEALRNGDLGILVEPHSPEQLSEALELLAGDSALRAVLGRKASMHVKEKYSVDALVEKHVNLYTSGGKR